MIILHYNALKKYLHNLKNYEIQFQQDHVGGYGQDEY